MLWCSLHYVRARLWIEDLYMLCAREFEFNYEEIVVDLNYDVDDDKGDFLSMYMGSKRGIVLHIVQRLG